MGVTAGKCGGPAEIAVPGMAQTVSYRGMAMATDKSARLRALETSIRDFLLVVEQLFAERDEMRRRWTLYKSDSSDESHWEESCREGQAILILNNKSADGTKGQIAPLEDLLLKRAFECPRKLKSLPERFDGFFEKPDLVWPYGTGGVRTSDNNGWADAFLIEVRGLLEEAQDAVREALQELPPPPPQSGKPAGQDLDAPPPGNPPEVPAPAPTPVDALGMATPVGAIQSGCQSGPNLKSSKSSERQQLLKNLEGEVTAIYFELQKGTTFESVKQKLKDLRV